jgi:ABC-2 type transport system permease protein
VLATITIIVGVQLANSRLVHTRGDTLDRAANWLRDTPPGFLGSAAAAASRHDWTRVALGVGVATATIAVAVAVWAFAVGRTTTRAEARATTTHRKSALFRGATSWLPRTRTGAVAARELKSFRRDGRRAAMLVPAIAIPLIWAISFRAPGHGTPEAAPFFALAAVVFTNRFSANVFGIDGGAYWSHVALGTGPRPDLFGKQIAISAIVAPIVVTMAIVLGVVAHAPAQAALAIILFPAVLGIHLGLGAVASARFPQAQPEKGNPFGTLSGQGCGSALAVAALLALELLMMLPVTVGLIFAANRSRLLVVPVVAFAWLLGAAVWWVGSGAAERYLGPRMAELLAEIDPRRS